VPGAPAPACLGLGRPQSFPSARCI